MNVADLTLVISVHSFSIVNDTSANLMQNQVNLRCDTMGEKAISQFQKRQTETLLYLNVYMCFKLDRGGVWNG